MSDHMRLRRARPAFLGGTFFSMPGTATKYQSCRSKENGRSFNHEISVVHGGRMRFFSDGDDR